MTPWAQARGKMVEGVGVGLLTQEAGDTLAGGSSCGKEGGENGASAKPVTHGYWA